MAFVRYRHVSVAITLALGLHLGCGGEVEQAVLASAPGENSELPGDDNGSNDAGVGAEGDSPDETGDAGPIATDAGVDPSDAGGTKDQGVGDGQDVVLIGDSWMNLGLGVGIQQSVVKAAASKPYRRFGAPGTRMLDGVIPSQYAAAKAENPNIKTVIMTGGGNDVLLTPHVLADCLVLGAACKSQIDKVGDAYKKLTSDAAADGVADIVIVLYTRGTLLGPRVIDYIWTKMTPICDSSPVRCHLLDPDKLGAGVVKTRDGIHPTNAGYDLIGEGVYALMKSEGMRR